MTNQFSSFYLDTDSRPIQLNRSSDGLFERLEFARQNRTKDVPEDGQPTRLAPPAPRTPTSCDAFRVVELSKSSRSSFELGSNLSS